MNSCFPIHSSTFLPLPGGGLRLALAAQALHVPWPSARPSLEEQGIPAGCLLLPPHGGRGADVHPAPGVCGWPPASAPLPAGLWHVLQLLSPFARFCPSSDTSDTSRERVRGINKCTPPREIRGEQLCPRKCLPNSVECGETNGIPLATTVG